MSRRFAVVFWLAACAAAVTVAMAASVGDPGIPTAKGRWLAGAEMNSLKDRDLSDPRLGTKKIKSDSRQFLGKVTYGLTDKLTIFGEGGTADLQLWDENKAKLYNHGSDLAYGAGFRVNFYEELALGLTLSAGGHYFAFSPSDTKDKRTAEWAEWQGSVIMSIVKNLVETEAVIEPFKLTKAAFHAGIKYSDVTVNWTAPTSPGSGELDALDNAGAVAGFDLIFNNLVGLNIELRGGDEGALTAGVSFMF